MKVEITLVAIAVLLCASLPTTSCQNASVQLSGYEVGDCMDAANWPVNTGSSSGFQSTNNQTSFSFFSSVVLDGWKNTLPYFCYHYHIYSFMYANVTTSSLDVADSLIAYGYSMIGASPLDCKFTLDSYNQIRVYEN